MELRRRQGGYGRGGRQRIETDQVDILSGIWHGKTLGSPIALLVPNKDYKIERMDDLAAAAARTRRPDRRDQVPGSVRAILERASAGKRRPGWRPARWPGSCWRRSASRPFGYVVELGPIKIPPRPGTLGRAAGAARRQRDLLAQPGQRRRDQDADRRLPEGRRHAGRHRRGPRRRAALRPGHACPVGPQARRPAGPGGDGRAGDQGRGDRPGLRGRPAAAARRSTTRSTTTRPRPTRRRWASRGPRTTPAGWRPA